jgi:hypothetical protein
MALDSGVILVGKARLVAKNAMNTIGQVLVVKGETLAVRLCTTRTETAKGTTPERKGGH